MLKKKLNQLKVFTSVSRIPLGIISSDLERGSDYVNAKAC